MNRANVTNTLGAFSEFLQCGILQKLQDKVLTLLSHCECIAQAADEITNVKNMFEVLQDPFEPVRSEYMRLKTLEEDGFYVPPENHVVGHNDSYRQENGEMAFVHSPVSVIVVPLRRVLKMFLELPGVFPMIMSYINSLDNETNIVNFMQGELWSDVKERFGAKLVLPLFLHFDDYEPNNALGSHAGDDSLGALYSSLACLPPQYKSSVHFLFLFCAFLTKARKKLGNSIIFHQAIQELIYLQESGIELTLENGSLTVYFCVCLIVADNKGNNSVHGFVEAFTANFFCRICKMHRNQTYFAFVPDMNLSRTAEGYEEDLIVNDCSLTGLKERCVWNDLVGYHVCKNMSVDLMHDFHEGLLKYACSAILHHFIVERGYFSLETLHERIDGFNYGPSESGNKPPSSHITVERISNNNLNLSASEMLCLGRYFGEMVGDLVPIGNRVWHYYVIVRELQEILTCPYFTPGTDVYFETLIAEHHKLYLEITGSNLPPKFHFLTHYAQQLRRNGPVVDFCALTSERKHKIGKMYLRSIASRVNPPLSVAIKLQLELAYHCKQFQCNRIVKPLSSIVSCEIRSLQCYDQFRGLFVDPFQYVNSVKSIDICGTMYKINMAVVHSVENFYPVFGSIVHIIVLEEEVKFILRLKDTVHYNDHFCAYVVRDTQNFVYVSQSSLVSFVTLWERNSNDQQMVSLKWTL